MAMPTYVGNRSEPRLKVCWITISAVLCFLYGTAFTLNIHPVGDGLWFWYARLFREHQRLYTDMHLALQPLFVLLTAWMQALLGPSWLASKVLAIVQLGLYCWGLWLLARESRWEDRRAAALLAAAFVMTLTSSYFRFDDYHITGYICLLFAVYLLLRLGEERRTGVLLGLSASLGAVSGIYMADRLNDGSALFGACVCVLPFAAQRWKATALATYGGVAGLTFLAVIGATGDSLREWRLESIVRAAAIKGASTGVWQKPFLFFWFHLANTIWVKPIWFDMCATIMFVGIMLLMIRGGQGAVYRTILVVSLIALTVIGVWHSREEWVNQAIAEYAMFLLAGMSIWALVRLVRHMRGTHNSDWNWRELLVAMPFLLILSGSVTSGLSVLEIFPPIAFFLILLPLAFGRLFRREWQRSALTILCCVIVFCGIIAKTGRPYHWSNFEDAPLFADRTWFNHPVYGAIYIERDQLRLMEKICAETQSDSLRPRELLAITNPYANWFCDVPPWHGYVQTWYDTTSRETIERLKAELMEEPPTWIVYQRSPGVLGSNEAAFGNGRRLPQRALDSLIMGKLGSGQWTLKSQEMFEHANWMVIETSRGPSSQPLEEVPSQAIPSGRTIRWIRKEVSGLWRR